MFQKLIPSLHKPAPLEEEKNPPILRLALRMGAERCLDLPTKGAPGRTPCAMLSKRHYLVLSRSHVQHILGAAWTSDFIRVPDYLTHQFCFETTKKALNKGSKNATRQVGSSDYLTHQFCFETTKQALNKGSKNATRQVGSSDYLILQFCFETTKTALQKGSKNTTRQVGSSDYLTHQFCFEMTKKALTKRQQKRNKASAKL